MLQGLETNAFLEDGIEKIPVTAKFASRYSLWIKFLQKNKVSKHENLTLILQRNGKSIKINPCKLIPSLSNKNETFRLVFQKDVYNAHLLLLNNQPIKLQASFNDLSEELSRKNFVKREFKEFVSNLGYDLSVYKNLFDDLDNQLLSEPEDIKNVLQKAIIDTEGKKFKSYFDCKVNELDKLVKYFNRKEHQIHGSFFRSQLKCFILCCPLMARTNLKPRGYPGDSKMMQMIYRNDYQGESIFGKLLHNYTVSSSAAQSVRNRQFVILDRIKKLKERIKLSPNEKIRILSIACGPAWELKKLLKAKADFNEFNFTLFDNDQLALNEARQLVENTEKRFGEKAQIDYVKGSVRTIIANKKFRKKIGKYHLIYSLGLFDYLTKPVAMRVMDFLYQQLIPDGELVVGNFHDANSSRNFMEYWGDWYLIHRTENELLALLNNGNQNNKSVLFENSKNQIFLVAKK